jgi:mono/diheme cytochrome c family protein
MSSMSPQDPRFDQAAASDETMLVAHEKVLGPQPDERAHYRLRPLILLFVASGCILFAATYLNRYSGHFSPAIYDENLQPTTGAAAEVKIDPVVMGKKLFNSGGACFTCHQPTGVGVPAVYPPLAGSEWANGPAERVIRIVLYGLQGPVTVEGKTFSAAAMPPFGPTWSDEKIADVLTYVRQEWGNKAPAVSADDVAAVRKVVGDRKAWSADELLQVK